ncbi:CLUMA_CG006318, isoform A [Clunio marinus]|uniref:CLUMA_CG006318, isoform A n=1 Tax=Clunio marinus TaxID=568069 RepID=A0A1J1HXU7_9DIPT|nr:CLUMA_CG006318, isoform A [Clunio marinus]
MSADSTATSDASDPGSPFSHTSTSTDDASAVQAPVGKKVTSETTTTSVSPQNGKTLKRQAQVTEKCDKKRVRKELCCKNNNVEIKIIPMTSSASSQNPSQLKKPNNVIKNTLSAITNLNVFKSQMSGKTATAVSQPPPIVIPSVQQPPNLAQLSPSTGVAANISKLTDYYKLKKEVTNNLSIEKYCNMFMNLQSVSKQNLKGGKAADTNISKQHAATTITPIVSNNQNQQQLKSPIKPINVPIKKTINEKKTAKIAPIIPVARKTTSNQMQSSSSQTPFKISPKKPVSIAPRIEPKPIAQKNNILQPKPTTTTTTTTTKLAPLLQFQQMIPNLIQLPNLVASTNKNSIAKVASSSTPSTTPQQQNVYVNNTTLTQQQQQQLFMNGAVIKLQSYPSSTSQSNPQTMTSSTPSNVVASMTNVAHKYAMHHQQQQQQQAFAAQLAAQQMQQLFMTTPVLFNTSSIPTVLTSQLAGLQHAFNQQQIASSMAPPCSMPALQPIQSSLLSSYSTSSMTSTTNSMQLPSISTILHNHPGMAAATQQFQNIQLQQQQNIPTLMKTSTMSLPPSLTITSGYMHNHQKMTLSAPPQATVNPSAKTIPPLAPASNIAKNLPKLVSVTSSSSQTSPKSPPPLVINQKVSLPQGSPIVTLTSSSMKQDAIETKTNAICVVPPLPSPAKTLKVEVETEKKITINELQSKDTKSAISVIIEEKSTIECAKSPILSQPTTIRFPPVNGKVTVWKKCIKISKTGVCNWEKCSKHFDSNSDLLDHLHQHHINAQQGPFMCSWRDCKVNGREGSKGWLERHVMSHVGSKPFKCIVERCGVRFSSQVQLEKHVNGHFNNSDQQNGNKRSSDPPAPKKIKKDQKKTKVRRQPWSARRFDFFDVGMMDILQYRLEKAESVMQGRDIEVTFKGRIIGKRRVLGDEDEYRVTWNPTKIIDDEWIKRPKESHKPSFQLIKNVSVKRMTPSQRNALQDHVSTITKTSSRSNGLRNSRKFSSTCSSRASVTSTST